MSFASLEAAAPHLDGRFVLITDDIGSDGNLLLHHYIALHLKAGRKVHLVTAEQSLFHYASVAKKAGLALSGNPLFHHTNALNPPYTWDISAATLHSLHADLVSSISSSPSGVCILIDSLSHFLLSSPTKLAIEWLRSLIALTASTNVFLVAVLHRDDVDASILYRLMYEANTVLVCDGLETGQARDVHGQVTIITRNAAGRAPPRTEKLHYRATDQTVAFFPPGSKLP